MRLAVETRTSYIGPPAFEDYTGQVLETVLAQEHF